MNHKIHVAFGFHVNCYHSYRGDTNDNLGFGSDIRIIRHIISVLDDFNKNGVPAKATWDTENFFSLEKILPEYAPDIIESMKRRVRENGDENIIMGYNNGALSAMTDKELEASINLARTNPQGSGLIDIFGKCEDIVRPQEVMVTPSQVTCGMVGLTDGEHGIIIANSRQVSGSMAHCPMRTDKDGKVKMNMMGTYYGRQRHHFSRSKCQVLNAYNLIAVQGKSIAPSYNGVCETALLGIFGFSGDSPSEDILKDIKAFSDGAAAVSPENSILTPFYGDNISFKKAKQDNVNENSLKNPIMTGFSGNLGKYIKYGSKAIYHIVKEQIKSK